MNKVYLSGFVAETPILIGTQDNPAHAVFRLNVSHKNAKGEWRRELYSINSWNAAAQWVIANLKQGQKVALVGYLTQRTVRNGDSATVLVEVTSQEFLPLAERPPRDNRPMQPNPAEQPQADIDDALSMDQPIDDLPEIPMAG